MGAEGVDYLKITIRLFFMLLLTISLLCAGYTVAYYSVKVVVYVDYNSGNICKEILLYPFLIRKDYCKTLFASFPLLDGRTSISANPDWHIALNFQGKSSVSSPEYIGAYALYAINKVEYWLPQIEKEEASKIKDELLRKLNTEGPLEAKKFAEKIDKKLLDGLIAESNK